MTERPENPELNLAASYALGILSPEEARSFERILASSEAARREVAEFQEVAAMLALQAPEIAIDPGLRGRVLARVEQEKVVALPAPPPPRKANPLPWLAAAAAVVAIAGLGWMLSQTRSDLAARDSAIASLRAELTSGKQQLAAREATLNAILDPDMRLNLLASSKPAAPSIQMFVNAKRGFVIAHAVNLPTLPNDRAYQLWFIPKNGKPIASVTFNAENTGHALVQNIPLPAGAELTAAAVTEEPAGGSPQPTSAIILSGAM